MDSGNRRLLIEAAQPRTSINIKLTDAIYAATALLTQCSTFITNDQRFRSVPDLYSNLAFSD